MCLIYAQKYPVRCQKTIFFVKKICSLSIILVSYGINIYLSYNKRKIYKIRITINPSKFNVILFYRAIDLEMDQHQAKTEIGIRSFLT